MNEIEKKEIDEMAKFISGRRDKVGSLKTATALYNAGYRKQSETVEEFAESLKLKLTDPSGWVTYKCQDLCWSIDKLAKQFGKEEK